MNRKIKVMIVLALGGMVFSTQADPIHRYTFSGNVRDSVGSINGAATVDGTYLEAPQYVVDAPPGAVTGAPTQSIDLGMNYPDKKSGFQLNGAIMTDAGSFSLWVKSEDLLESPQYILNAHTQLLLKGGVGANAGGLDAIFRTIGGGQGGGYATNAWNHVAVVWDNVAKQGRLYINGTALSAIDYSSQDSIDPAWLIFGGYNLTDNDAQMGNQADVRLYDLQFYGSVLSGTEVSALYNNPGSVIQEPTTMAGPPIHRYTFSGNARDSVGSINGAVTVDGTYLEAPQYVMDAPLGAVAGAPTQAMEVGMNYPDKKSGFQLNGAVITDAGSFSLWFKSEDPLSGPQYILNGHNTHLLLKGGVGANAGGLDAIFQSTGGGLGGGYAANEWNHVAVVWDNTVKEGTLYMNGTARSAIDYSSKDSIDPAWLIFGGFNIFDTDAQLVNQANVRLYDLQFYDSVLSGAEVSTLYNNPGSVIDDPSTFEVVIVQVDADELVLSWSSEADSLYSIFTCASLGEGWQMEASGIEGQASHTSYTTTVENATGFYRIKRQ